MKYENGERNNNPTRHKNVFRAVLIGKKSWGLWVDQWSDGIADWTFTLQEILEEFESKNIEIPEPFLIDFKNRINKKKEIRNQKEFERLHSG